MRGIRQRKLGVRAVAGAVAVALASVVLAACGSDDDSDSATGGNGGVELKVGFVGALEGPQAIFDVPTAKGAEYAAKEINEKGEVDGQPIEGVTVEFETKDFHNDPSRSSAAVQELLDGGTTSFISTTNDVLNAQAQQVTSAGGVFTTGGATQPEVLAFGGAGTYSVIFTDPVQAAAMAEYACDQGYKTAYTMGSPDHLYLKNLPAYFEDAFAEICDGEVTGSTEYKLGTEDFSSQVSQISNLSQQPDVIFSPIWVPDDVTFLKQLRGAGVDTPFLSTDGTDSSLFDPVGAAGEGTVYSTHGFPREDNVMTRFLDNYEKVMGEPTETPVFEAIARDCIYVLALAAQRAGTSDPEAIREELDNMSDVELATETITMDPESRVAEKDIVLVEFKDGKRTFLKTTRPSFVPEPEVSEGDVSG